MRDNSGHTLPVRYAKPELAQCPPTTSHRLTPCPDCTSPVYCKSSDTWLKTFVSALYRVESSVHVACPASFLSSRAVCWNTLIVGENRADNSCLQRLQHYSDLHKSVRARTKQTQRRLLTSFTTPPAKVTEPTASKSVETSLHCMSSRVGGTGVTTCT